jgi:hypothetical protein
MKLTTEDLQFFIRSNGYDGMVGLHCQGCELGGLNPHDCFNRHCIPACYGMDGDLDPAVIPDTARKTWKRRTSRREPQS